MIIDIRHGDITTRENSSDIIIAMNTELGDVRGIGKPFVSKIARTRGLQLGSVFSFSFDTDRALHMLICHKLGTDGWTDADSYVRFGLDFLWQKQRDVEHSIVRIGTGRVGKRDGADHARILTAMATSHLKLRLFVLPDEREQVAMENLLSSPNLVPFRQWSRETGETPIRVAA
jgi:hypothetical protein